MSEIRKAVILSAGHGTRLLPMTAGTPKVMLPVGGVPLLERHVRRLAGAGAVEICLNLHAHPNVIRNHFGDGSRFGVRIHYALEPSLQGTAGALAAFRDVLDCRFAVHYGDVYSELDWGRMARFHDLRRAAATLAVHPSSHPEDSDIVEMDALGKLVRLHHKPGSSRHGALGNAGSYLLEREVFRFVPEGGPSDFIKDVFPAMLAAGLPLFGYRTDDVLFDMGTPERLSRLEAWMAGR